MAVRILFVCEHRSGTDGWSTYVDNLISSAEEKGWETVVCCAKGSEGQHPILHKPLRHLEFPFLAITSALALRSVLRRERPDVIHFTVEPYALLIPFLPRSVRNKIVLTVHGTYGVKPLLSARTRTLARRYYNDISRFIAVSNYTKRRVSAVLKETTGTELARAFDSRCAVIANGIVLPPHASNPPIARVKQILCVGGVKPRKGILESLRALATYRTLRRSPFEFHIVGNTYADSAYAKSVRNLITELSLEDCVRIRGRVSEQELSALYASADAYLMPSQTTPTSFEGFGLVFLEAAARGVPCIGPKDGGAAEAIAEGRSGFRIDPNHPEEIAERLVRILDEGKIRRDDCRTWAQEHSLARMSQSTFALYHSLTPHVSATRNDARRME